MSSLISRLNKLISIPKSEETPFTIFWKGAFYGLAFLSLLVMTMSGAFFQVGIASWLTALATLAIGIIAFWLFRIAGTLIHKWIGKIPSFVFALFFGSICTIMLARYIRFGLPAEVFYYGFAATLVACMFLFGSGWLLIKKVSKNKTIHATAFIISFSVIVFEIYFLANNGRNINPVSFDQTPVKLLSAQGISNPGESGQYNFDFFTYGSGSDTQRAEFSKGVKYQSHTVDASLLIPEWKDSKAKWRERYWGFGSKGFPLNGRVWMPKGEGKFPLILVVHGNHGMEDYSDPGYAYLGELLSSRGFITVSVDENFVNGTWSGDFRGKEMPVRGWLLLKHLEQWQIWNNDSSHALYQKVDLDNIILAGHSRGGEAAPIGARFNKLKFFPDNANVKFNFNFGIKGVIAIAPTDKRYDRRMKLDNINYLTLQGSYDSDEASFFGQRQYQRITFSDSAFHFKSGLYIHGANHGQFNSTWGRYDGGPPFKWLLNTAPQISMDEQQQIAKVYIAAFAEAVLHNNKNYVPLFKNAQSIADWLPSKILINTYKDSNSKTLITYEEDIDLTTGTVKGSIIRGTDLKIWRETELRFRDKDTQGNNAAVIGWKRDSTKSNPTYSITLESNLKIDSTLALMISMAEGNEAELKTKNDEKNKEKNDDKLPLNFSIQLLDSAGNKASLDIIEIKKLTPRLKIQYVKLKGLNQESFGDDWEPTPEYFEIPIQSFKSSNTHLLNIKEIRFNFDKSEHGVLILDEIGLNH